MRLSIRATTFASALTALVMVLLTIPFHLARWHWMAGMTQGSAPARSMYPWMHGTVMQHANLLGWPIIAWILLGLAVVVVYAGVVGAIFAALYNAFAPKQS